MFATDFTKTALAAIAAMVISSTCIAAAVGPAYAVENGPAISFAAAHSVSDRAEA